MTFTLKPSDVYSLDKVRDILGSSYVLVDFRLPKDGELIIDHSNHTIRICNSNHKFPRLIVKPIAKDFNQVWE